MSDKKISAGAEKEKTPIDCVVHFSGGLMSFGAAKMAVEKYGAENTVLLFADTGSESPDTYKFILQAASYLGARLEIVRCMFKGSRRYVRAWDLFFKHRVIANWKFGECTQELKKKPLNRWVKKHAPNAVNVIGFSIEEVERIDRLRAARPEIRWEFPLAERPYKAPCHIVAWVQEAGLEMPQAYARGESHNNCSGACFKMGIGGWARLYKKNPELFAYHEAMEKKFREETGLPYVINKQKGKEFEGGVRALPLSLLREEVDAGRIKPAPHSFLPCACGILWGDEHDTLPLGWGAEGEPEEKEGGNA